MFEFHDDRGVEETAGARASGTGSRALRSEFIKIGTKLGEVDRRCTPKQGARRLRGHKSMPPQGRVGLRLLSGALRGYAPRLGALPCAGEPRDRAVAGQQY